MQQRDLSIKTIDNFIDTYPENVRVILQEIRTTINRVMPGIEEKISYGIPTFTLNGKNIVHFSAYKSHIGFYPGPSTIEAFSDKLNEFKTSKGAVQFPLGKSIPYQLIEEMTRYAVKRMSKV